MKDTKMRECIRKLHKKENSTINLIASENILDAEVKHSYGWERVVKYCEGFRSQRYYGGCDVYNEIEELTKKRALDLFSLSPNTWDVIVQSYSGSIANLAIYIGCIKKGGGASLCAPALSSGGHLSHGSRVSITSTLFAVYRYGVDEKYNIDYASLKRIAETKNPSIILSGASAFSGKISFSKIGAIAKKIKSTHVADISHYAGLISANLYPSPFPHADVVMSTTHKTLHGPRGALIYVRKKSNLYSSIEKALFPGIQGGPHVDAIAGIGTGLLLSKKSTSYYKQVYNNTRKLSEGLEKGGIMVKGDVAAHMILISLQGTGYNGKEAQDILERNGILVNMNVIDGDKTPLNPSGIRVGTYAITHRGAKEKEMYLLGETIAGILTKSLFRKEIKRNLEKIQNKLKPLV